jgi:hypothetical protein
MQQPNPDVNNTRQDVADALITDLALVGTNIQPACTEDYLYFEAATLAIVITAHKYQLTNVEDVLVKVKDDIEKRRQLGIAKYGVALKPHSGRDMVQDMYEEALDLVFYAKCNQMEKKNAG